MCAHSYRAHRWWELASKQVGCRVQGCSCPCFAYLPMRGSTVARCGCKHELHDHGGGGGRCSRCSCQAYAPPQRCDCGMPHAQHTTVFETRSQRQAGGRAAVAVGGGRPDIEAATGGVIDLQSLLPAGDRLALQHHHPHPLLMQQQSHAHAPLPAPPPSLVVRLRGVAGCNCDKVNGLYCATAQVAGGQLLWRKMQQQEDGGGGGAVIECMPNRRSWQVKPESRCVTCHTSHVTRHTSHVTRSLGKDGCWAAITHEGELQGALALCCMNHNVQKRRRRCCCLRLSCNNSSGVHGCSGWRIWDGSSKTFHEQVQPQPCPVCHVPPPPSYPAAGCSAAACG